MYKFQFPVSYICPWLAFWDGWNRDEHVIDLSGIWQVGGHIDSHHSGSTIYSDWWSTYCSLNDLGYKHFTVLHKYSFKKIYVKESTREEVEIHTNRIEGTWKHGKERFQRMSGTKISQFEGHLCEFTWRAEAKSHMYGRFFGYLKTIYTLMRSPAYTYPKPIFLIWSGLDSTSDSIKEWEIKPGNSLFFIFQNYAFLFI